MTIFQNDFTNLSMFTKKRKLKKLPKPKVKFKKRKFESPEKKFQKFPKLKKIHIIIFAMILFFLGLIFYILKFQTYKIKSVDCFVNKIECSQVGISIPNLIGENFFKYDLNSLTTKLSFNYPRIKEIKTKKKIPCKFVFEIILRTPKALIEDKFGNRFFIDEEGMIFSQALEEKKDYIIIKTEESVSQGQKIFSNNTLYSLNLIKYLEGSLLPVKQIIIQNKENLRVDLQNGKIIYFTTEKDVQKQADSLIFILNNPKIDENKKNIIDLRFENPIVK